MSNPIGAFGATAGGVGAQGRTRASGRPIPCSSCAPRRERPRSPWWSTTTDRRGNAPDEPQHDDDHRDLLDAVPSNQVAAAWVELTGPNGSNGLTGNVALARAITEAAPPEGGANPCSTITVNGGAPVQMNLRAAATTGLALRSVNTPPAKPALFPVSACEYQPPSSATSAVVAGQSLPMPKARNSTKIVVLGDTGCRLQNGNGTQSCNDPDPNGTDTPYPFAAVAAVAAQNPDLALHVGDDAYRNNPCPAGQGYNCGGSPWGFGWNTWQADLFARCEAARRRSLDHDRRKPRAVQPRRQGWYRFLDTSPYDTTGVHTCDNPANDATAAGGNWSDLFLVNINSSTQVVVFDTANAKPQFAEPGAGDRSRVPGSSRPTRASLRRPATCSPLRRCPSTSGRTTTPSSGTRRHLPTNPIPVVPVMNSVFPGTYFPPPINLALHGHTHDYQAINLLVPGALPDGGTFQPAATLVEPATRGRHPRHGAALPADRLGRVGRWQPDGGQRCHRRWRAAVRHIGKWRALPEPSSTDNDFGYMVLQFNAGSPLYVDGRPGWTTPCVMSAPFRRAARSPALPGASSSQTTRAVGPIRLPVVYKSPCATSTRAPRPCRPRRRARRAFRAWGWSSCPKVWKNRLKGSLFR